MRGGGWWRGGERPGEGVQLGVREGGDVPELRDGKGGGAIKGVLWRRDGDQEQRARVPVLHHPADAQWQQPDQEHGHTGGQAAPAPYYLQVDECQC